MLSKEQIKKVIAPVEEKFTPPGFKDCVKIKTLILGERLKIITEAVTDEKKIDQGKWRLMTLISGCLEPSFSEKDAEWIEAGKQGFADVVSARIWEISGVSEEDLKNAFGQA